MAEAAANEQNQSTGFIRGLGLLDSTMIVGRLGDRVRHFPAFVLGFRQSPTGFFNY